MLGEIYVGSALAIFFAIFGWSDRIFGLSKKTTELELQFCNIINLTYRQYLKLMKILEEKDNSPGEFAKKLVSLLKKSKLKPSDNRNFKILKKNKTILEDIAYYNKIKKRYFLVLLVYLFVSGTILIIYESLFCFNFLLVLFFQVMLGLLIIFGFYLYVILARKETEIHSNFENLITEMEGNR